jgi:2-keto-4-pentenoate hydratase/2-oxohepta-3-ene-1,7-dioic acid hydratase in catechol pathway
MYERAGAAVPAMVLPVRGRDVLVDLVPALRAVGAPPPATLVDLLPRWPELAIPLTKYAAGYAGITTDTPPTDLADVRLLPPVGPGQLIVCCGFNYAAHEAEVGGTSFGTTWFIKNANSTIGSGDPIVIPPDNSETVDYEGELAVVIGRPCHRVPAAEALRYVAGYTLVNDVSARLRPGRGEESTDDIKRSVINSHLGKQYPSFCPIGPTLITADEVADPRGLSFTTSVNGVLTQRAQLRHMRLGVPELIAWLSNVFAFRPGDIISTGSPAGSGISQTPPLFLKPTDVVTVAAARIGELRNTVTSAVADPATSAVTGPVASAPAGPAGSPTALPERTS